MTLTRASRCLVVVLLALASVSLADPESAGPLLRLHPDLPEILDRGWVERLVLFEDVPDLETVQFGRSVWGGVTARLETAGGVYERSLSTEHWAALRLRAEAVLAGEDPPPPPPSEVVPRAWPRVWPEAPPPPAAVPRDHDRDRGPVSIRGQWMAIVEAGARLDVSGFNTYFTPMGSIGISFAYGVTDHLAPILGFYAGFGDMRREFESAWGDGRANAFGFTLTSLYSKGLGERHQVYVEGGGGYHIRSLYWGGAFYDQRTNRWYEGRALEQRDLGWNVRVGWQLRRSRGDRPRLLDVGLGFQSSPADLWLFPDGDTFFEASDRDLWMSLTFRLWDGL